MLRYAGAELEGLLERYNQLSEAERLEVDAILAAQEWPETLLDFQSRVSPSFPAAAQVRLVADVIERARRERIRVCLSMPPRHGKTYTILNAIAWWLRYAPADTHAYVSYNNNQAWSKSKVARTLARRAGVELDKSSKSAREWRTLAGGGLLAGGIGGGLTGQGVSGCLIIDDPFKDRTEADSNARRDEVWDWFTEVAYTRQEGCSYLVIHTR